MIMRNAALAVFVKTFAPIALISAIGMVAAGQSWTNPLLLAAAGASFGLSLCLYGLVFGPSALARGFGPFSARVLLGLGLLAGFGALALDLVDGTAPFLFLEAAAINRGIVRDDELLLLFGSGLATSAAGALPALYFSFSGRVSRIISAGPATDIET